MTLDAELALFRERLPTLLGPNDVHSGKWAVIKGREVLGPFKTYDDALSAGYGRFGPQPFLAKKIERNETVYWI